MKLCTRHKHSSDQTARACYLRTAIKKQIKDLGLRAKPPVERHLVTVQGPIAEVTYFYRAYMSRFMYERH